MLSPIADDILCHHEYWDGSGYPQGLAGEDIPLLARIITILDFYDAVTYGGVNHDVDQIFSEDKITKEQAINFLQQGSGQFFDPQLTKEFIELISC